MLWTARCEPALCSAGGWPCGRMQQRQQRSRRTLHRSPCQPRASLRSTTCGSTLPWAAHPSCSRSAFTPQHNGEQWWHLQQGLRMTPVPTWLQVLRNLVLVQGSLAAAKRLHVNLLSRVLQLSMAFHDSTPTGRLLNRFARDTDGGVHLPQINPCCHGVLHAVYACGNIFPPLCSDHKIPADPLCPRHRWRCALAYCLSCTHPYVHEATRSTWLAAATGQPTARLQSQARSIHPASLPALVCSA